MPHPQIHLQRTYWRTNNETQNQCIFFNLVVLVMEPLVVYTDILIWLKISEIFFIIKSFGGISFWLWPPKKKSTKDGR